jgi:hypothetical protein
MVNAFIISAGNDNDSDEEDYWEKNVVVMAPAGT